MSQFSKSSLAIHIIIGLILGATIALVYLAGTDRFKLTLQKAIEEKIEQDFHCILRCKLEQIDWFGCKLIFSGVHISPKQKLHECNNQEEWSIVAENFVIQSSWMSLLFLGYIKLNIQFDHMVMLEIFNDKPYQLSNFCSTMFTQAIPSWIVYDGISITDGLLYLKKFTDDSYAQIPYTCHLRGHTDTTKMQIYLHDGMMHLNNDIEMNNINGSIIGSIPYDNVIQNFDGRMQLNACIKKSDTTLTSFFTGTMKHGIAQASFKTNDNAIVTDSCTITCNPNECICQLHMTAHDTILSYCDPTHILSDISGHLCITLDVDLYNIFNTLKVSLDLQNILYKNKPLLPGSSFTLQDHTPNSISGIFKLHDTPQAAISITKQDDAFHITGHNTQPIFLWSEQSWNIAANSCTCDATYTVKDGITGSYNMTCLHPNLQEQHHITGTIHSDMTQAHVQGTIDNLTYQMNYLFTPNFIIKNIDVSDQDKLLLNITMDENNTHDITGSIDFALLHRIVPYAYKSSFSQEGSFVFQTTFHDGIIHTALQTHYAHIRIPYVYNVIQNITAQCDIDTHQKKVIVKDARIEWYEGTITCSQATWWFDKNFNCYALHIPLMFDQVMLSWKKSMYGLLTGRVLISCYQLNDPYHIESNLIIHKADLQENILSAQFHELLLHAMDSHIQQQSTIPFNADLDLSICTQDPLLITTSFLTARAQLDMQVTGTVQKPSLTGMVKLASGSLLFPYKPLEIVEGRVLFIPEQPLDPIIELIARGKLKKYNVSLHAWGSVTDPHIQFDAQPYLTEEQILSLLLLGIEDQSLSIMIPAFLTQRLQEIIFGPALSNAHLQTVFDKLLKSLKYVRFLPQFTNQTGRGGIKGIFDIDISDHLHGKIETNFIHIEDTKFDVDYGITDDITLRLQKDGPSTYGGEVEFRWKFS